MKMIYEKETDILMRDCDRFRRLKPSAMLAMFQDCSEDLTEGWGMGLDAMLSRGLIWVAAKVECRVCRLPEHSERVTVRGWACRSRSGIYPFRYEIRSRDNELLAEGCSMWVLSDLETHSMMSPSVPRLSMPTPEPDSAKLPRMSCIRAPETFQTTARRVQFSEVDINGHLTNTRYMDWICDLADADFHREHPLTGVRIDYRTETFPDEEVTLEWSLTDERLWCRSEGKFDAEIRF